MAIETFGLTAATLAPYLTQMEGQFGTATDGLSDTDIVAIIEDQAAALNAALVKALGADGVDLAVADDVASRNCRRILINLVLPEVYRSVFSASVLPEFLRDQHARGMASMEALTKDPAEIGLTANRSVVGVNLDADDDDDVGGVQTILGTASRVEDRW